MMSVEISGRLPTGVSEQVLKKLAHLSQKISGTSGRAAVTVTVVDDAAIRRLNRQHRGQDRVTDVLSFGYDQSPGFPFSTSAEGGRFLGDIVISGPQARRQAAAIGRPVSQEFALLFVHGLLHLQGQDHDTPAREARMFACQQEILMRAGIF